MSKVEHRGVRQGEWTLAAVGVLAALVVSCSRVQSVEVRASGLPPVSSTVPAEPAEKFQGSVAAVDAAHDDFVVSVRIIWTPVVKAAREDRRVTVGPQTRWVPTTAGLAQLRGGDEVQVEAVSLPDGTWQARTVQLFDVD